MRKLLSCLVITLASGAWGDTICLKDGKVVQGIIRARTDEMVIIEYERGKTKQISASDIDSIKVERYKFPSPVQPHRMPPSDVQQQRMPPSSISEAKARHSIKVGAGDSSSAIIAAYGKPSSDEELANFAPPLMRELRYESLGLEFLLNTDRICRIQVFAPYTGEVNAPYSSEVFGFRVNDLIDDAIQLFGKDYIRADTGGNFYTWEKSLPNWFFYVQHNRIVMFTFIDSVLQQHRIPPRCISEAKARHSIKVGAGDSSSSIIAAYGNPSSDRLLMNYQPAVMRELRYESLGLEFTLNRDRIGEINVYGAYRGEVFGFRVNDSIGDAIKVFGKGYSLGEQVHSYTWPGRWEESLPKWFFHVQDKRTWENSLHEKSELSKWLSYIYDSKEETFRYAADNRIVMFQLLDPAIYGNWNIIGFR